MSIKERLRKVEKAEVPVPLSGEEPDLSQEQLATLPQQPAMEDDNPFAPTGDELTAVSLGAETISTDPEKLPIIANHNSTRAFAAISAKADWLEKIGDKSGAATRQSIRNNLLKFGISQAGESNRVAQLFDMLKAAYSFEQQKELSTGERVMGSKK